MGKLFVVPTEALALAVATEWNGQKDVIKRHSMHLVGDLHEHVLHLLTLISCCSLIRVLRAYFAPTYLVSVTVFSDLTLQHSHRQPNVSQSWAIHRKCPWLPRNWHYPVRSTLFFTFMVPQDDDVMKLYYISLFTDINSMNRKSYTTCNKSDGCLWLITQTLSECGADEVDCRLLTFASRHVLQLERCWWSEMCWRYEVRLTPTTGIGVPDISSGDKEKIRQYLNSHTKWTLTGMTHPPPFSHNSIM